jgi:hypothetical protein
MFLSLVKILQVSKNLISGSEELGLNEEDLEEDFDPEKYDQRMSEIFKVTHFLFFPFFLLYLL